MDIKYNTSGYSGRERIEQYSIEYWITDNINHGGIESQISKLTALMAIIGETYLRDYPHRADDIAYAIDSEGNNFEIIDSK